MIEVSSSWECCLVGNDAATLPRSIITIWSETEVTAARESASRPAYGIVGVRTRGINQRREVVCEFARSFLVPKRAAATAAFPATDETWGV